MRLLLGLLLCFLFFTSLLPVSSAEVGVGSGPYGHSGSCMWVEVPNVMTGGNTRNTWCVSMSPHDECKIWHQSVSGPATEESCFYS